MGLARQNQSDQVPFREEFILFIRYLLYPEMPRNLVRGTVVKWFASIDGSGCIRQDSGENVQFYESDVVEGEASSLQEGQEVEFEIVQARQGLVRRACNVRLL